MLTPIFSLSSATPVQAGAPLFLPVGLAAHGEAAAPAGTA